MQLKIEARTITTLTMDGDTKKKVIPELAPRALLWFRWGAAYTWILGVFLLYLVFENGKVYLTNPSNGSAGSVFFFFSLLLVPFIYVMFANIVLV